MERFGKPVEDILDHKKHFWDSNEYELNKRIKVANIYSSQPKREYCKICSHDIDDSIGEFSKHGVEYRICGNCQHLNGLYRETDEFVSQLYNDDEKQQDVDYGEEYLEETNDSYQARLRDIYSPKANFLFDALEAENENPENLGYADFGAGAGYMMAALDKKSASNVTGYEVSLSQVNHARNMNDTIDIRHIDNEDIYQVARSTDAEVVTMIGVIEHLRKPIQIVESLRDNESVKYVFCTFPMFSPAVFFELTFPNVMPRHLTLGHTHLFQESSIDWLKNKGELKVGAEWWFGQDMIDLIRSVEVTLNDEVNDAAISSSWQQMMYDLVDEMQEVLDRNRRSSSVHLLFKST